MLLPGTKLDYKLLDAFPNISHLFGTQQYTMAIFWLEAKWFKRHSALEFFKINDGCDLLKEIVVVRSVVEKGEAMFGGKGKL